MFTFSLRSVSFVRDKTLFNSFIFLVFGLLSGVFVFVLSQQTVSIELNHLLSDFNKLSLSESHSEIFTRILLNGLSYFIIMYMLGGSIFGKYLCPVLSIIKMMGISLITSHLYCCYGLKGFEYALLVFFPGKFILLFAILYLTKICIDNSRGVLCCERNNFSAELKAYCIKSAAVFLIFLLSWIIDFLCSIIFSELFS